MRAWKKKQSSIHHRLTLPLIFIYTSPAARRLCFRFNLCMPWERRRLLTRCRSFEQDRSWGALKKRTRSTCTRMALDANLSLVFLFFCCFTLDGCVSSYYSSRLGGGMDVPSRLDSTEMERTVFGVGVLQNYTRYGQMVFHCSCMDLTYFLYLFLIDALEACTGQNVTLSPPCVVCFCYKVTDEVTS